MSFILITSQTLGLIALLQNFLGDYFGVSVEKNGVISRLGSFRGRFGDHFRVGIILGLYRSIMDTMDLLSVIEVVASHTESGLRVTGHSSVLQKGIRLRMLPLPHDTY